MSSRVAPLAACSSKSTDSVKLHWWQPIKLACSISQGASIGSGPKRRWETVREPDFLES
ncbi:hypothetical protein D3C87_1943720 [compost metagenome]